MCNDTNLTKEWICAQSAKVPDIIWLKQDGSATRLNGTYCRIIGMNS